MNNSFEENSASKVEIYLSQLTGKRMVDCIGIDYGYGGYFEILREELSRGGIHYGLLYKKGGKGWSGRMPGSYYSPPIYLFGYFLEREDKKSSNWKNFFVIKMIDLDEYDKEDRPSWKNIRSQLNKLMDRYL